VRHVRIASRNGDTVTVAAGAALGVTAGSKYAVHPQGTKSPEGVTALGTITITAVRATAADARIDAEQSAGAIVAGAYAFETDHAWGDLRLAVEVAVPQSRAADAEQLRAELASSAMLRVVEAGQGAAVRVYLIEPRAEVSEGGPVPQIGAVREPLWAAVGETGELVMPLQAVTALRAVRENLNRLGRYRQSLALDNPDQDSVLRGRFTITLLRRDGSGGWAPAEPDPVAGQVVFEVGDEIAFRVESRHDKPVYVNLLNFGLAGAVNLVHPEAGAQEQLRANGSFDVGTRGEFSALEFPDTFPFADDPVNAVPAEGVDTVKLIVTESPVDFSFLNQASFEAGVQTRGADDSPLMMLFHSATSGGGTRDFGRRKIQLEDWTTVVKPFVLRRKRTARLVANDQPVELGGVTLMATGIAGDARLHERSGRALAAELGAGTLIGALEESGVEIRHTVELAHAQEVAPSSRSAGDEPSLDLTLRDPGPNHGQMLMATDELGLVSWHFAAPAEAAAAGSRGAGAPAPDGRRTYRIAARVPLSAPAAGARGVIGFVGSKLFKELVFPLVDPVLGAVGAAFAGRWEASKRPYRVRQFTPDDYMRSTAVEIDGDGWRRLSAGRALLFVHGTFSRAHSAFGTMPRDFIETLHQRYEGRVFALDHFTLSQDPRQNVDWLLDRLPGDVRLDLDIICHSRGGLVSRVLSEKQGELNTGSRSLRVGRVIFVGSPNAGTVLADPAHMGDLIDTYTNLLNFIPDAGVSDMLAGVVTVAKTLAVGAVGGLKGLQSMQPAGPFGKWLNSGGRAGDTRYFALSSDFTPSDSGLVHLAKNRLMDLVFKGPNDLVVPTDGVFAENGSGFFPIEDRLVFTGSDSVAHTAFFTKRAVREKIMEWIGGEA
jgi:hypothetical protein